MVAVDEPDAPAPPAEPGAAQAPAPAGWPDPDLDPEFPDIDGVVISEQTLSMPEARTVSILRCRLTDCELDVDLEVPVEVHDSVLTGVDLTGRRLTSLTKVRLERCRLGGVDLGDATIRDVAFHDCVLDLAAWRGATVERVAIRGGRLDGLDLSGAGLTDLVVADAALVDVTLDRVRAERVDLADADLSAVSDVTQLRGCTISPSQAMALAARLAAGLGVRIRPER